MLKIGSERMAQVNMLFSPSICENYIVSNFFEIDSIYFTSMKCIPPSNLMLATIKCTSFLRGHLVVRETLQPCGTQFETCYWERRSMRHNFDGLKFCVVNLIELISQENIHGLNWH